jgi:hypothetical protein
VNNLEVDFEERKEYNFVMDILKTKKNNAQIKIPENSMVQVVNREREIIIYNRNKQKRKSEMEAIKKRRL